MKLQALILLAGTEQAAATSYSNLEADVVECSSTTGTDSLKITFINRESMDDSLVIMKIFNSKITFTNLYRVTWLSYTVKVKRTNFGES